MPLDPDPVSADPCRFLALLIANGRLSRAQRNRGQATWSELQEGLAQQGLSQRQIWHEASGAIVHEQDVGEDEREQEEESDG